jgi:hypothetical protein
MEGRLLGGPWGSRGVGEWGAVATGSCTGR